MLLQECVQLCEHCLWDSADDSGSDIGCLDVSRGQVAIVNVPDPDADTPNVMEYNNCLGKV